MSLLEFGIAGMSQLGQYISQGQQNKKNKELAEWANLEERKAVDLKFERDMMMWNRQNAYNTPASQMARFQDAGLNPNLIYGQGTHGNATSSVTSDKPRIHKPNYQLPKLQTLSMYNDLRLKNAQIDNVQQQTEYQNARTTGQGIMNDILNQDLNRKTRGNRIGDEYDAEMARLTYDTTKTKEENTRLEKEAKQIHNKMLNEDLDLKEYQTELRRKYDIQPGDELWQRLMIMRLYDMKQKMPKTAKEYPINGPFNLELPDPELQKNPNDWRIRD